jgi:glucokinase
MDIVTADIGGTHARFAVATYEAGTLRLGPVATLKTAEYASLPAAWEAFAAMVKRPLPRTAAIALAAPVRGETLTLTNSPWVIHLTKLQSDLQLDAVHVLNDFGAVTHALPWLSRDDLALLCGPDILLPREGAISVLGPGTGLGVGLLLRRAGQNIVVETEGGHVDFAPIDDIDISIMQRLQGRYQRVSVERLVSGPGLAHIYEAMSLIQKESVPILDDKALWTAAIDGSSLPARRALDRFCMMLGTAAGDAALMHGASAVVLAGGIPPRVLDILRTSGFAERFCAKGRFQSFMEQVPVYICVHPQPGLLGAAASLLANTR